MTPISDTPFLGGGVFTYDDVARHIMGGCDLVGLCSSVYSRGICEDLCPYGAITVDKSADKPAFDPNVCYGCGWCAGHCPQWAVKMVKADTGELIWDGRGTIKDWVSDDEGC